MRSAEGSDALARATHSGTPLARFETSDCLVSESVYQAGQRTKPHEHELPFLFVTLSGTGSDYIDGTAMRAIRGDAGLVPAGCPHSHVIGSQTRGITIDILPSYATALAEYGANFRQKIAGFDPLALDYALQLRAELLDPDPLSRFQIEALIMATCVSLMRFERSGESTSQPRWLRRLAAQLQERYKEKLSLDEIAAETGHHRAYVSQAFRRHYGETLSDHIRRLRIKEGRRLLERSTDTLAEIAAEVGYHDESHFCKAFKKVTGTTPGEYRRVLRSP